MFATISPSDLAEKLMGSAHALADLLPVIPEEPAVVPILPEQEALLRDPSIHATSHARAHIPYFTPRMCLVAQRVLETLRSSPLRPAVALSPDAIRRLLRSHLPEGCSIIDLRMGSRAWRADQILLQMKIAMASTILSRGVNLPPQEGRRAVLHRRHAGNGAMGAHFLVKLTAPEIRPYLSRTGTMMLQIWLGTPDTPDVVAGTMYAGETYPDEPTDMGIMTGILFKTYRCETERETDARHFIEGVRHIAPALLDPVEYQAAVIAGL